MRYPKLRNLTRSGGCNQIILHLGAHVNDRATGQLTSSPFMPYFVLPEQIEKRVVHLNIHAGCRSQCNSLPSAYLPMDEDQQEQILAEKQDALLGDQASVPKDQAASAFFWTCLSSLGIVFGDLGTSPLYALNSCFQGDSAVQPTAANVTGILSLVCWSLLIVVGVKYVLYVMWADNCGEGGILALSALVTSKADQQYWRGRLLMFLGIAGAALLYGDGMITPAISVLSAIEGLQIATPAFTPFVVPATIVTLVILFLFQRRGTAGIGAVFGPVMALWFVVIALLGAGAIVHHPEVLFAVNPAYAIRFLIANRGHGFLVLGAVFLVCTGGEALYADMGQFGRKSIRAGWYALVLPALLINYFGQGAILLMDPSAVAHPFYMLAPSWALYPLVALATCATVIASQAIISGAFSLTRQAVLLGDLPRLHVVQTSHAEIGQVYIPVVNSLLMIATIVLVVAFRSSDNLAAAYGVAVSMTMVITTLLAHLVARRRWHWSIAAAWATTCGFLAIDLSFLSANMLKVAQGGWVPIVVGAVVFVIMTTWKRGTALVHQSLETNVESLESFVGRIASQRPERVPGSAVYLTHQSSATPSSLATLFSRTPVLHEQVVLLTIEIDDIPRVPSDQRVKVTDLGHGFIRVHAHFGFMDQPDLPTALADAVKLGLPIDPQKTTYFMRRDLILLDGSRHGMANWRKRLYRYLETNAADPVSLYRLPLQIN